MVAYGWAKNLVFACFLAFFVVQDLAMPFPKRSVSDRPWRKALKFAKCSLSCGFRLTACATPKDFDFAHFCSPLPGFIRKESGSVSAVVRALACI